MQAKRSNDCGIPKRIVENKPTMVTTAGMQGPGLMPGRDCGEARRTVYRLAELVRPAMPG